MKFIEQKPIHSSQIPIGQAQIFLKKNYGYIAITEKISNQGGFLTNQAKVTYKDGKWHFEHWIITK